MSLVPDDRNELAVWDFCGQQVRTCLDGDGNLWWAAKDVCDILGIVNSRNATARLHPHEKGVAQLDTPGGKQKIQVVSQSGLYKLIFKSTKPDAERFQDWVTSEVLPSIFETGQYIVAPQPEEPPAIGFTLVEALETALQQAKRVEELKAEKQLMLEEKRKMLPAVEFAKEVMVSKDTMTISDASRMMPQPVSYRKFFDWLEEQRVIFRDQTGNWKPHFRYLQAGYFDMAIQVDKSNPGGEPAWVNKQTRVTFRGLQFLIRLWREKNEHLF